jgi:hypothetical protein
MGNYPTNVAALTTAANQPGTNQSVGPWLRDVPSSSHYTLEFGALAVSATPGPAANGYQPGVLVVTPTAAPSTPVPGPASAYPGTAAATSASVACAGVK